MLVLPCMDSPTHLLPNKILFNNALTKSISTDTRSQEKVLLLQRLTLFTAQVRQVVADS